LAQTQATQNEGDLTSPNWKSRKNLLPPSQQRNIYEKAKANLLPPAKTTPPVSALRYLSSVAMVAMTQGFEHVFK